MNPPPPIPIPAPASAGSTADYPSPMNLPTTIPPLGTYLYWSGMKSWNGGTQLLLGNNMRHNDPHPKRIRFGTKWICVEMKIKLNDPVTASNGELEIWQDGVEVGHWGPGYPNGHWAKDTWIRNPSNT